MINTFSSMIKVTRYNRDGKYIEGVYSECTTSLINIVASVQPLTGNDLLLLPEGERMKESIRIYTQSELLPVDELNQRKADIVEYNGKLYEVHDVKRWTQIIPHYQVVAVDQNNPKAGT